MNSVAKVLNENYRGKLVRLEDSLNSTNEILRDILNDLIERSQNLQSESEYDEALTTIETQKNINNVIKNNVQLIDSLNIAPQSQLRELTSYNEYLVNTSEPHGITEDFRFKRPHAFQLNDHYEEIDTWKEMLVRTCEYLYKLNPKKFTSFASDESMQWGNTHNFDKDKNKIREPQLIANSGVYVEVAKGAIGARQLIIKMLESYNIDIANYQVFLRADYSPKREQDENYRRRRR